MLQRWSGSGPATHLRLEFHAGWHGCRIRDARGFTLLEVMIAFVIAVLAPSALIAVAGAALQSSRTSARYQDATARGQSRLTEATATLVCNRSNSDCARDDLASSPEAARACRRICTSGESWGSSGPPLASPIRPLLFEL